MTINDHNRNAQSGVRCTSIGQEPKVEFALV